MGNVYQKTWTYCGGRQRSVSCSPFSFNVTFLYSHAFLCRSSSLLVSNVSSLNCILTERSFCLLLPHKRQRCHIIQFPLVWSVIYHDYVIIWTNIHVWTRGALTSESETKNGKPMEIVFFHNIQKTHKKVLKDEKSSVWRQRIKLAVVPTSLPLIVNLSNYSQVVLPWWTLDKPTFSTWLTIISRKMTVYNFVNKSDMRWNMVKFAQCAHGHCLDCRLPWWWTNQNTRNCCVMVEHTFAHFLLSGGQSGPSIPWPPYTPVSGCQTGSYRNGQTIGGKWCRRHGTGRGPTLCAACSGWLPQHNGDPSAGQVQGARTL